MMQTLQSRVTGKLVLLLFLATNGVYFIMLGYSIPKVMSFSGGLPLFDMSPMGYSYENALTLLGQLGEEGRHTYLSLQLVLDLFYPALFGLCYFFLCQWLIKRGGLTSRIWLVISLLPALVCLFDYAENVGIWLMLTNYPSVSELLVSISSFFTLAKSVSTMVYFAGLMMLLCLLAGRKLMRLLVGVVG